MPKLIALALLVSLITGCAATQDARPALEGATRALGGATLKSIEYSGTGDTYSFGQTVVPGQPWPKFTLKSYTASVNYETAAFRRDQVVVRVDPRGGGVPAAGEARQITVLNGEHAWTVTGDAVAAQPRFRAEMQVQLWATPHGVIRQAMSRNATLQGNVVTFAVPGSFTAKATLNAQQMVDRVEAVFTNQVMGDTTVEVTYADYRDFGGVKFPARIRQTIGGHLALDLTVSAVKPNAPVDIPVPDAVRSATNPYARVTAEAAAPGVWYMTGGSHHSVAIEMKDHVVLVEAPLDDSRALAVIAEVRKTIPNKPIRYVVTSHNHFDHAGGVRAAAGEGITVITHESNRAFFERALAAPAKVAPDHLAKSGKRATVEGVGAKRVLTDGTRTVEIHHVAGNNHGDGMLMVYLPAEKLLSQADMFTPPAPNTPPPPTPNPNTVNLADNIQRLNLAVDRHLPLHGRIVPAAELNRVIGRQ